ncbi:hypothetical protein HDF16_002419 [Granulicella aggregans]|uniref:OpgC protein n=1 Tax=Granulicella aggregans TaxID=474949 RepID=A0A7W7ZD82_9BACT|nr:OpgC domain-containing protein [Granulicella aggregans]MBB5057713.1 hypothetical protein [Granulicella aggregans]
MPRPILKALATLPKLERKPEIDALRGLFLVWMTLTHLPTHFSDFVNQPFGFVSSAEGFVFLSALLVARLYIRKAAEDEAALRAKLWKRALKIYGYHVILLALAFTIAAAFAVTTHRAALSNLLDFYLAHPVTAIVGSLLLIYCPPLLDILPMYVIFLLLSPYVLAFAARRGWKPLLALSTFVWFLAQFGLRHWVHDLVVRVTHLQIPLQQTGAFNLFSWQLIWLLGMWIGARSADPPPKGGLPFRHLPSYAYPIAAAICLFFLGVRHGWLGPHLTEQALSPQLDKWQLAAPRMLNLIGFSILIYWFRKPVKRIVLVEPFLTLGKASLEVFCAHIVFVFIALALLYGEITQLRGLYAAATLILTFAGLILIAIREVRIKREEAIAAKSLVSEQTPSS